MDTIGGETVREKANSANPFLPDDLIPNILSRLPAKSAIRCRLVCRRWRDLTLDRDFVDLQFRNSIPTILVVALDPMSCFGLDLFALDKWWEPVETTSLMPFHRFPVYAGMFSNTFRALFSHAGLVVFQENQFDLSEANFKILNPTSRENVRITLSKELRRSKIFGVYFHPLLKEYCSLWMMIVDHRDHPEPIQYKMLNLGSNPSFKKLSNLFSNRFIKKGVHANPLFIKGYLYWMLESEQGLKYDGCNDIMEFDIISEEFTVIPCPVPLDTECRYYQTQILDIYDILSFLLILPSKITIWRLEDHTKKIWTAAEYTFSIPICAAREYTLILLGAIAVVDGKLALWSMSQERLIVCNLMEGTMKNYQKRNYCRDVVFLSHRMSLASLRDCKPTIFIDKDGSYCCVR